MKKIVQYFKHAKLVMKAKKLFNESPLAFLTISTLFTYVVSPLQVYAAPPTGGGTYSWVKGIALNIAYSVLVVKAVQAMGKMSIGKIAGLVGVSIFAFWIINSPESFANFMGDIGRTFTE
jgi:hypothetical protein